MYRFINRAENAVSEMLEGLALAHKDIVEVDRNLVINKKLAQAERVTIVVLSAAGNEPAMSGYVGEGMVDIAVVGSVFAAPGPQSCAVALKLADRGCGVLLVVANQTGDELTARLAMKQAVAWGLNVRLVVVHDDVSENASEPEHRRGLLGCVPLCKIAGAAAAAGKTLAEVADIADRFANDMATIAVLAKGAAPFADVACDSVMEGTLQLGAGQYGEGGRKVANLPADAAAELMLQLLTEALQLRPGDRVLLLASGSGATTLMEQLIVYRAVNMLLAEQGVLVAASAVGELMTVLDAAGLQVCVARMDDELLKLWHSACNTPYLKI